MILSDRTIRESIASGRIVIEPLDEKAIQPSSVDLRLGRYFRVFLNHTMPVIDVKQDLSELTREVEIADGEAFILHPGEFVLGSTHERVGLPDDLVARIEGKSSLGRLGLLIHSSLPARSSRSPARARSWRLTRRRSTLAITTSPDSSRVQPIGSSRSGWHPAEVFV